MESNAPPPFLVKTYDMVDDISTDNIVSWSPTNNSFVVWNPPEFARDLLPKYFKHNNFSSFVRQLNTYGFRKVDPDRWEFANEGFLRGQKQLLRNIIRRKPAHAQQQQPHGHNAASFVEVGKFGLEEEVERLKRDKNVLMQELVRLRQQQQSTDSRLQGMMQCLQGMEQRQQQMMSFLAKAVNNPGFLAHFVQQNESSSKKRRIKPDIIESQEDHSNVTPADGQIVKYQPIINEAAKAFLKELVKLDPSPRLDGDGSPESRVSGVTLQEVPETSCQPLLANNQYSVKSPLVVGAEDSPPVSLSAWDMITAKLSQLQANNMDESSVDGKMPSLEIGSLSPDPQFRIEWPTSLLDYDMEELPSVDDPFWEKFLQSPPPAETEDVDDISKTSEEPLENGSDKAAEHMEQLTEQTELLTSNSKKV